MAKITVKRIVPLFSVITERFKKELDDNSLSEVKRIDEQILAVTSQIAQIQGKFGGLLGASASPQSKDQTGRSLAELNERLEKLKAFKQGLVASFDAMKQKQLGDVVQTGIIENYVELKPGDNIRNIYSRARIVIKDDVIQEIVD